MSTSVGKIKSTTRAAQAALVSTSTDAIFLAATIYAPFLKIPLVKILFKFILEKTLEFLTDKGIIYFNVVWIRINVSSDAANLEESRQAAIKAVHENKSDEELDKLDQELINEFKKLNRFGRGPL